MEVTSALSLFKVDHYSFDAFSTIATQTHAAELAKLAEIKSTIASAVEALNVSCPCAPDKKTCANIAFAIPILAEKYGLTQMEKSVQVCDFLQRTIALHNALNADLLYYGIIIRESITNVPCAFFLLTKGTNIILRCIRPGDNPKCTMKVAFQLLREHVGPPLFIYTSTAPDAISNAIGWNITSVTEPMPPLSDLCADHKLFAFS